MRPAGGRKGHHAAVAAVVLAAAAVLAGCTSVRNDLGTSNSGCYVALPAASAAVGDVGRLLGVRLVDVSSLPADSHLLYRAATTAPGPTVQRVCLVGFAGHFEAAGVGRPVGRPSGTLAVVELAYPDSRLLATLLVGRDTLPFGHSHLGLL